MCEREAALLVPGYTGSKEDFLAILGIGSLTLMSSGLARWAA